MVLYRSTRDDRELFPSMDVIIQGISPEGGLFVPVKFPSLTCNQLQEMIDMDYLERAQLVLRRFLTDFKEDDLRHCVNSAYGSGRFDSDEIAPVIKLNDRMYIQELWHGPTCAFKDMALQIMPHFMKTALRAKGQKKQVIILVATSGDTGKAALEGFKDIDGIHIVVFYPLDGVSHLQKLQMVTQEGNNVHVVAVKGNFDDAQTGVKDIFTDAELNKQMESKGFQFSSANSINWGRLVPQIVYYVSAYLDMRKMAVLEEGEAFNIVVPTGNFGNILAAYYAKKIGLPIHKLICASNQNKVLTDFIRTGTYDRKRDFFKTISPSMDILISSNLERLLFELVDRDHRLIGQWMDQLKKEGAYSIDDITRKKLQEVFWGGFATEGETMETIRKVYEDYDYIMDPHTAVGKKVYDSYVHETGDKHKTLLVSTASPYKFARDVLRSIVGEDAVCGKEELDLLKALESFNRVRIPKSLAELRDKDIRHKKECLKNEMKKTVLEIFQ